MQFHFHSSQRIDDKPVIIAAEDGIEVTSVNEYTQLYMCRGHLDFPKSPKADAETAPSIKKILELHFMKIAEMY